MRTGRPQAGFHYALDAHLARGDFRTAATGLQPPFTYTFHNFFHPFVAEIIEHLNRTSLRGILNPDFQSTLNRDNFADLYTALQNTNFSVQTTKENIDLTVGGPYANYNWELLFHVPLAIAVHLSKNQRFAEAQRWFHLVFDPTANDAMTETPQRFWNFGPFRESGPRKRIEELLTLLSTPETELDEDDKRLRAETLAGYAQSMDHPFQPYRVAATRPLAYQYWVVMKYLDNLLAWGDTLFLEGTAESVNEATMRYVLAKNILGPRPQELPARGVVRPKTFAQLKAAGLDAMGNAMVELEGRFPFNQPLPNVPPGPSPQAVSLFGIGRSLYFCIPRNDKLLNYWATVDDRLFKARHCMDIHGTVRQLPQFDSPLDPGMLVKAAAAGIDVSSIVTGLTQPPGPVRALPLIQKSLELCTEVKGLGTALLAAMEKRDGEQLARLHSRHEMTLQQMSKDVAFLRIKQAEEATESLLRNRQASLERYRFYLHLLGLQPDPQLVPETLAPDRRRLTEQNFDSTFNALVTQFDKTVPLLNYPQLVRAGAESPAAQSGASSLGDLHLSTTEQAEMTHSEKARDLRRDASIAEVIATVLTFIPEFDIMLAFWGLGGKSKIFGGSKMSDAIKIAAEIMRTSATWESDQAGIAGRTAGHERRVEEWTLQANLAARELMNVGRQAVSSLIAEQMARHEYDTIAKRIDQAGEIEHFLRKGKQTGEELYTWMQGEVSRLYYEYYRFAVDTARHAEGTMKRELMRREVDDTSHIRHNYWDRGREGLLAAEALHLDLKRMELTYHENNRRENELTRHVSLRQLNPVALLTLKITGRCEFSIPESLFDRDCPGHYMRRLKTVALSLPAVAGPYASVNCTLTLLRSQVRTSSQLSPNDAYLPEPDAQSDERFVNYLGSVDSVATSGAINDSGMFETNLHEERFLPFEGAGAVGTWRLELPSEFRGFDYSTISDAILHIRYTARSGGRQLSEKATEAVRNELSEANKKSGLALLFSLPHDFPTEWAAFKAGDSLTNDPLTLTLRRDLFPYMVQGELLTVDALEFYLPTAGQIPPAWSRDVPPSMNNELNGPYRSSILICEPGDVLKRDATQAYLVVHYSIAP
jgi:hypothetical protein